MSIPRVVRSLFLALAISAVPAASYADISISVNIGPPALPVYEQPPCPGDGYIWTPGYWAWGPDGYYWVPGTWVVPPSVGLLWTPGYWGWTNSIYVWHPGYWGPHVGFYGGVNYGYGYSGFGYGGGRWMGNRFAYNTVVNNVRNVHVQNVYVDRTVIVNNNYNRVSFNGGPGGVNARPNQDEMRAFHDHHIDAPAMQMQHEMAARADRNQFANVNHGRPAIMAAPRPLSFEGQRPAPGNAMRPAPIQSPASVNQPQPFRNDAGQRNNMPAMDRGDSNRGWDRNGDRGGWGGRPQAAPSSNAAPSRPQPQQFQQAPQPQQVRQQPQQQFHPQGGPDMRMESRGPQPHNMVSPMQNGGGRPDFGGGHPEPMRHDEGHGPRR